MRDRKKTFLLSYTEADAGEWIAFKELCDRKGHSLTWKLKDMIRKETVKLNQGDE